MSLLWHIVAKDVRRMAIPVAGWLGFVLLGALWFAFMPRPEGWDPSGLVAHAEFWAGFIIYIQGIIGFILIGAMVLEDPTAGTNQFWATRPVGNRRLFAAKMVAVALLFVVAPMLLMGAVWLANGFVTSDLLSAAGRFMLMQALIALFAFALAALAEDLRQFLGITLGFGLLSAGFLWGTQSWTRFEEASLTLWRTRMWFVQWFCLFPLVGFVVTNQYLARRTARTWMVVGCAAALALGISLGWHGNFLSQPPRLPEGGVAIKAAKLTGREGVSLFNGASAGPLLYLDVPQSMRLPLLTAPLSGIANLRWADGSGGRVLVRPGTVALPVVSRAVAASIPFPQTIEWPARLGSLDRNDLVVRPDALELDAEVTLGLLRAEHLGEIEAKEGAKLAKGASRLRIVSIEFDALTGNVSGIVVEERDAWTARDPSGSWTGFNPSGWFRRASTPSEWWGGRHDGYVLRMPTSNELVALNFHERGAVIFQGMRLTYRILFPSTPLKDLAGALLVKVRFHEEGHVRQSIVKQQVPVVNEREPAK